MPAAIAIPAIVGAASSIGGAAIQAQGAKSAAKTQQKGADRALQLQSQVYNDQRALMDPYVQAGQSSIGTLGRLMGVPEGARFASAPLGQIAPVPMGQQRAVPIGQPSGVGPRPQPVPLGQVGGPAPMGRIPQAPVGQGGEPAQLGAMPQTPIGAPQGPRLGNGGPALGQMGQFVTLRAPDGSVQQVPGHLAQQYMQRGAVRVE
jgi:hypothetical protein